MNKKTILSGVLCLALAAVLGLSPVGIRGVLSVKNDNELIEQRKEQAAGRLKAAEQALVNAVTEVNDERTFDVYYGDLTNLTYAFNSIGVEIDEVVEVLPMEGFREGGVVHQDDTPAAVRYTLMGSSVMEILGILEQMELPVYSIIVNEDASVEVTFLTGGTL